MLTPPPLDAESELVPERDATTAKTTPITRTTASIPAPIRANLRVLLGGVGGGNPG